MALTSGERNGYQHDAKDGFILLFLPNVGRQLSPTVARISKGRDSYAGATRATVATKI